MTAYPHTIDNGAGERLTFIARRRDEQGEYLEGHNTVEPGAGPPMHVHHRQEESLTSAARSATSGTVTPSRSRAWARP